VEGSNLGEQMVVKSLLLWIARWSPRS